MTNPFPTARPGSRESVVAAGVREGSVRGPEADELLRARLDVALAETDPIRRRTALLDLADTALSVAATVDAPPYEPLTTTSGGYRITETERLEAISLLGPEDDPRARRAEARSRGPGRRGPRAVTRARAVVASARFRDLLDASASASRSYDLTPAERREAVADAEALLASAVARQAEHEAGVRRGRAAPPRR